MCLFITILNKGLQELPLSSLVTFCPVVPNEIFFNYFGQNRPNLHKKPNWKKIFIKRTTHYYSAIFKVLAHFSLKRSNFVNCKKLPFAVRWWVELLKRDHPLTSHPSLV